jgi:hypothetical protein
VNTLHPLDGSNWTNVIFSIVPLEEDLTISTTWLSILRSHFTSFVVRQSTLHLTESIFGNSSSFEVVKFPGGITIVPPQNASLLQPHATFNFTLNYPIYKIQDRTNELKDQMKAGLLLNPYEVSCTFWVSICACLHYHFSMEHVYKYDVHFILFIATFTMLEAHIHLVILPHHVNTYILQVLCNL